MLTVKKTNRYGYTFGCWRISREQATELCQGQLPKPGYEKTIAERGGHVSGPNGHPQFPTTFRATITNHSNAEYLLTDENNILGVTEK